MALPVSQAFLTAQAGDANFPAAQVQLVLGNYASSPAHGATASSSGADGSGNYPASGAIDGDRTELNVGAASTADNDVGLSSWRSSGTPDNGDTVTLTINLITARTINRIKLYHLSGHGLKTYKLSRWTGSVWVDFAATSDIVSGSETSIVTTGTLDIIDFPDVTTTQLRLTVTATQVSMDKANVVELEAYRKVDISLRVKSIDIKRQRDYKLSNPLATSVQLSLVNDDRFFSPDYVPTADEVEAGFVNSELAPNMGLLISLGFNYFANLEQVQVFTGLVDRLGVSSRNREGVLEARDTMKPLINKVDSSKLKTSIDIGSAILYVLNRANISSYETAIDTTGINIDYFFSDTENPLTTIRDLAQASGDSSFYFDEKGFAVYRFFNTAVSPLSHTYTSESDWEAGTLSNIATKDGSNSLKVPVLFAPALIGGAVTGQMAASAGALTLTPPTTVHSPGLTLSSNVTGFDAIAAPFTAGVDTRIIALSNPDNVGVLHIWADSGGVPGSIVATGATVNYFVPSGTTVWLGYDGVFNRTTTIWRRSIVGGPLVWVTGQGKSKVHSTGLWTDTFDTDHSQSVSFAITYTTQDAASGTWTSAVYDSASIDVAPTINLMVAGSFPAGTSGDINIFGSADNVTFDVNYDTSNPNGSYLIGSTANRRYWKIVATLSSTTAATSMPSFGPPTFYFASTGTWTSPVLDTGVATVAYTLLVANFILNNGSVVISTRSSADGVTFDPYVPIALDGTIQSTVRRYIQVQTILTLSMDFTQTPQVNDITVNWLSGGHGHPKFPTTASFVFKNTDVVLDIQQELADNLGGDTSIINDAVIQAQPLVLGGVDTDTAFQGTVQTPPVPISGSAPLSVNNGDTIILAPVINGGMDTTHMSGANPSAAVVTFGSSATGSWTFTSIHPTRPVLKILITHAGTITDLRIVGKTFSNNNTIQAQQATDAASIAQFGDRQQTISNKWIVSTGVAANIAADLVSTFKSPVSYIPTLALRPTFSAQLGDRVTIVDDNTALDTDYQVVQLSHNLSISLTSAQAGTDMTLLKIPA